MTKHILVIDDEADIQEVICLSLHDLKGWYVVSCPANQAMEKAKLRLWDAIVMEVALHCMNGLELFATLQANPTTESVPIILLTSKVLSLEIESYQRLNVAGIIAKPFDPRYLGTQISRILGWPDIAPSSTHSFRYVSTAVPSSAFPENPCSTRTGDT